MKNTLFQDNNVRLKKKEILCMGNWTGKWKSTPATLCKCECGKENGAEVWTEEFDN